MTLHYKIYATTDEFVNDVCRRVALTRGDSWIMEQRALTDPHGHFCGRLNTQVRLAITAEHVDIPTGYHRYPIDNNDIVVLGHLMEPSTCVISISDALAWARPHLNDPQVKAKLQGTEPKKLNICTCNITNLMRYGCKCGGR